MNNECWLQHIGIEQYYLATIDANAVRIAARFGGFSFMYLARPLWGSQKNEK
jgi:hypothetical protein